MSKMKTVFIYITALLLPSCYSVAEELLPADSVQKSKNGSASNLKLVTRLHSLGQFAYGGRIVSDNPTFDLNFTYDRKAWGFQLFKAQDLRDHSTQINFALAVINKSFHIGKRLTITPSAGFILEQSKTIADHGSDVVLILNTAYRLSPHFTIDQSSLVGNVALEPEARDWVNRLRVTYSRKHVDLIVSGWHNNKVFDAAEYLTIGTGVFYGRVKLSPAVTFSAGLSALWMPYSNDILNYPKKDGLILSVALILD